MYVQSNTPTQEARGCGFYLLLLLLCFQEARISQTTHEQPVFHGNLLSHLSPECGCFITSGFLTCEKVYSFLPQLCVPITSSDEHFLNNKREGDCHWHL